MASNHRERDRRGDPDRVDVTQTWEELTDFQKLLVDAIMKVMRTGETPYGLEIKAQAEAMLAGTAQRPDVNHGTLYPNLDKLQDYGYVDVSKIDNRTKRYELTTQAVAERQRVLKDRSTDFGLEVVDGEASAA